MPDPSDDAVAAGFVKTRSQLLQWLLANLLKQARTDGDSADISPLTRIWIEAAEGKKINPEEIAYVQSLIERKRREKPDVRGAGFMWSDHFEHLMAYFDMKEREAGEALRPGPRAELRGVEATPSVTPQRTLLLALPKMTEGRSVLGFEGKEESHVTVLNFETVNHVKDQLGLSNKDAKDKTTELIQTALAGLKFDVTRTGEYFFVMREVTDVATGAKETVESIIERVESPAVAQYYDAFDAAVGKGAVTRITSHVTLFVRGPEGSNYKQGIGLPADADLGIETWTKTTPSKDGKKVTVLTTRRATAEENAAIAAGVARPELRIAAVDVYSGARATAEKMVQNLIGQSGKAETLNLADAHVIFEAAREIGLQELERIFLEVTDSEINRRAQRAAAAPTSREAVMGLVNVMVRRILPTLDLEGHYTIGFQVSDGDSNLTVENYAEGLDRISERVRLDPTIITGNGDMNAFDEQLKARGLKSRAMSRSTLQRYRGLDLGSDQAIITMIGHGQLGDFGNELLMGIGVNTEGAADDAMLEVAESVLQILAGLKLAQKIRDPKVLLQPALIKEVKDDLLREISKELPEQMPEGVLSLDGRNINVVRSVLQGFVAQEEIRQYLEAAA